MACLGMRDMKQITCTFVRTDTLGDEHTLEIDVQYENMFWIMRVVAALASIAGESRVDMQAVEVS